ncbi:hypothetical protein JCM14244_12390 [Venenivibrio stagnispumantis]|uniref:Lipopolysaccharide export system permease protein n=1 Tax=Venenivibrio stagnispumantis TaxID=407998 RepID=A0AA45WN20_9AQUI|nr:LptF/LptG family permease [Venenivibrio stagnispumantis]MCW4573729.1 LptF/LptG family permease [Venenivibrio stagnispumantis]SMP15815.1 lipopolysaccharide export system permease protein [Venenivibrio stagnispumantis]
MMKLIDKILIKRFIKIFFILVAIFSLVIISSQMLHLPKVIYFMNIFDFFQLLILMELSFIKYLILFAFFISSILTGAILRESNEIYAIYSSGISQLRISKPIFYLSIIFVIIALFISTFLVPYANRERAKFLTTNVKAYFLDSVKEKNFFKVDEKITIYVNEKKDKSFKDIFIYNKNNGYLITAKYGEFIGNYLILKDGYLQLPSENSFSFLHFNEYRFNLDVEYLKQIAIEDAPLTDLFRNIQEKNENFNKSLAILSDRFFFFVPFLFFGVSGFLLGIKLYSKNQTLIATAVSIGIAYMIINFYFVKLIEKSGFSPLIYFIILIGFFSSILIYAIKKE